MPGELQETFVPGTWYDVRVEDAHCDESGSGTAGVIIKWMVTDGEMAGKYVVDERWITQNSAKRHREELVKALGYDISRENLDQIGEALVGHEATIRVKIEEWPTNSGNKRVKIDRLRKKGVGTSVSPARRIAMFFGNDNTPEEDPASFDTKKFD